MIVEKEVRQIGNLTENAKRDNPQRRRVYDPNGISPTLTSGMGEGGNLQPFTVVAMRGRNPDNPSDRTAGIPTEQRLEVNHDGVANCLTSVQKDCMVLEQSVLTPKRTEYGKAIRKAYESGEIKESRHNMKELEPRTDGISNTLTTVQKDNMILEKSYEMPGKNFNQRNTVHSPYGICRTIIGCSGSSGSGNEPKVIDTIQYRIRKLTPRECGRLMNCSDDDITRMVISSHDEAEQFFNDCEEKGIRHTTEEFKEAEKLQKMSNTQLYRRFGNAICIEPLMAMFRNLNIKGVKTWNEVLEERRNEE